MYLFYLFFRVFVFLSLFLSEHVVVLYTCECSCCNYNEMGMHVRRNAKNDDLRVYAYVGMFPIVTCSSLYMSWYIYLAFVGSGKRGSRLLQQMPKIV